MNGISLLIQIKVSNYWEAIGVIAAHKAGIDPISLRRNRINNIPCNSNMLSNGYAYSRIMPITWLMLETICSIYIQNKCSKVILWTNFKLKLIHTISWCSHLDHERRAEKLGRSHWRNQREVSQHFVLMELKNNT